MRYLIKRILIFIPTFIIITMIAFGLQQMAPGDPIDKAVRGGYLSDYDVTAERYKADYLETAKQMELNKPAFYFSVKSIAYPKDYFTAIVPSEKKAIEEQVQSSATLLQKVVPAFRWHGLNNRYHHWLMKVLLLDFGNSYADDQPVSERISRAVRWTLTINGIAILLAFALSIWLGVWLASTKKVWAKDFGSIGLYILYSVPSFWTATMLVVFFTTAEYGAWTDLFPTMGIGRLPAEAPFWNRFWETAGHLLLPIFCLTYGALAFITMQMRKAMQQELGKPYIQAARARGFDEKTIIWREAFPNALFPMITLFALILPALFTGSVVIEVIFGIPGMGLLTYDAILQDDWPVVYGVLVVIAVLTMLGNLLGDVLYAWLDPRVTF